VKQIISFVLPARAQTTAMARLSVNYSDGTQEVIANAALLRKGRVQVHCPVGSPVFPKGLNYYSDATENGVSFAEKPFKALKHLLLSQQTVVERVEEDYPEGAPMNLEDCKHASALLSDDQYEDARYAHSLAQAEAKWANNHLLA
jgi:hypothetical protein